MTGKGPLTSILRKNLPSQKEISNVARRMKLDSAALISLGDRYVDFVQKFGNTVTPLHFVSTGDRIELLVVIVEEGWSVNHDCSLGTPLSLALDIGCISAARKLLELGADFSSFDSSGKTPMFYALSPRKKRKTCLSAVKILVKAGVSLDASVDKENEMKPLHVSVLSNMTSVVSYLLQMGADGNVEDIYKTSPIHYAVMNDSVEIIGLLMKHKVKLDKCDLDGLCPLTAALNRGKVEILAAFVENGLEINGDKHSLNKRPLLHLAVTHSNLEIVKYLVESGADPNAKSTAFMPALYPIQILARSIVPCSQEVKEYKSERLKIFNYLVEKGLNVNCSEHSENSPLFLSILQQSFHIAKAIIHNGGKVNLKLPSGSFLFHLAVQMNHKIIITFLEFGADYNLKNNEGLTPYHVAIKHQVDVKFINVFIKMSCPYDQVNSVCKKLVERVNSPKIKQLFEAQCEFFKGLNDNSLELVQSSVAKGAIPTGCSEEIRYPLHFLIFKGHENLTAYLLEQNFPPNSLNDKGEAPLHVAAKHGNLKICSMLLRYGACYNWTSKNCCKTPAKLAEESKHTAVRALFQRVAEMFRLARKKPKVLVRELSSATNDEYLMFVNTRNASGQTLMSVVFQHNKVSKEAAIAMMDLRLKCEL